MLIGPRVHFSCAAIAFFAGCLQTPTKEWRSAHHQVSVSLENGWKTTHISQRGDTVDSPDKLLMAFLQPSSNAAYILRIERDETKDQIADDDYFAAVVKQFTSNSAYELIDQGATTFRGQPFFRVRFRVTGSKGPAAMYVHLRRANEQLTTIQWTFPIPSSGSVETPAAVADFDRGVRIGDQAD